MPKKSAVPDRQLESGDNFYLMESTDGVKIGVAGDVARRLADHRGSNPSMRHVAHMECPDAYTEERRVLNHFKQYIVSGEHLAKAPDVMTWVQHFAASPNTTTELDGFSWPHKFALPWEMERLHSMEEPMLFWNGLRGNPEAAREAEGWYTEPLYCRVVRSVMEGGIDLDPFSSFAANRNVQARSIYIPTVDGMVNPWFGNMYLHPPWQNKKLTGPSVERLLDEYRSGFVSAAVLCLSLTSVSALWFRWISHLPMCVPYGRVDHLKPGGGIGNPRNGTVFVYLGPDPDRFAEAFDPYGRVRISWSRGR